MHAFTERGRKVDLGIDADTLEIRAIEVAGSRVGDAPILPELLDQIPAEQPIGKVSADGAHDTRGCHSAIAARGVCAVIPARNTARPWLETTPGAQARNQILRSTRRLDPSSRPHELAALKRVSSAKPGRNKNALPQAAWRARHGTRLRQAGIRSANQGRDPEPLYGTRNAANSTRGMRLLNKMGRSTSS